MKVLLVGGSGMVGTFVTPYLAKQHELRVLDVRPPQHADLVEYVEGSIANPDDVARALEGMDSFVNMVMRNPAGANETTYGLEDILNNYEVNTIGLHVLLWTAQSPGDQGRRPRRDEERPLPAPGPGRADRPLPGRGDDGARCRDGLRLHEGPRRTGLPAFRRALRHAPHLPADHRAANTGGVSCRAASAHPQGPLRPRRGGPRERHPVGARGRQGRDATGSMPSSSRATSTRSTTT